MAQDPDLIGIDLFGDLPGGTKWSGCVLGPDGTTIYGIPSEAEQVLAVNCRDKTIETFGKLVGGCKWCGGALAPDGVIYCAPAGSTQVLAIDTRTHTTECFGKADTETAKYSAAVLGPDKRTIFCVPWNSEWVMAFDIEKRTITEFGYRKSKFECDPIPKKAKWTTGVLGADKRTIFCIPGYATTILAIDTQELTVEQFGELPEGAAKWGGAIMGPDGKTIFGIPLNSQSVLALNTEDRTIELFGNLPGKRDWRDAVLGPDGVIYGLPACSKEILQIWPKTRRTHTFKAKLPSNVLYPGWQWSGGCCHAASRCIFGIPMNSSSVLVIGPLEKAKDDDAEAHGGLRAASGLRMLPRKSNLPMLGAGMLGFKPPVPTPLRPPGLDLVPRDTDSLVSAALSGRHHQAQLPQLSLSRSVPSLPSIAPASVPAPPVSLMSSRQEMIIAHAAGQGKRR